MEDVKKLPAKSGVLTSVTKCGAGGGAAAGDDKCDAHCAEQTDQGAAADDREILYIIALSSGVHQLPAQLQMASLKYSKKITRAEGSGTLRKRQQRIVQ